MLDNAVLKDIREEMKQLAAKRRRFGYRRTGVLREGNENEPQEKLYRSGEKLTVKRLWHQNT